MQYLLWFLGIAGVMLWAALVVWVAQIYRTREAFNEDYPTVDFGAADPRKASRVRL